MRQYGFLLFVTFFGIFLDQFSKWAASQVLTCCVTQNSGIAFSIPLPNPVMIWLIPILLVILLFFVRKHLDLSNTKIQIAIGLILAGALGNWVDRIAHDGVRDFIDLGFWPSFNLADSMITIGALLLLLFSRTPVVK